MMRDGRMRGLTRVIALVARILFRHRPDDERNRAEKGQHFSAFDQMLHL